jgi:hypothetical protein
LYASGYGYIASALAMAGLRPVWFTSRQNPGDELNFQTLLGQAIAVPCAAPSR